MMEQGKENAMSKMTESTNGQIAERAVEAANLDQLREQLAQAQGERDQLRASLDRCMALLADFMRQNYLPEVREKIAAGLDSALETIIQDLIKSHQEYRQCTMAYARHLFRDDPPESAFDLNQGTTTLAELIEELKLN